MDRIRSVVAIIISVLQTNIEMKERLDIEFALVRDDLANLCESIREAKAGLALIELGLASRFSGTPEYIVKGHFEYGKCLIDAAADHAGIELPEDFYLEV